MLELLAGIGILSLLWALLQRLCPPVAFWRSAELNSWAAAMRQTQRRLIPVWRIYWHNYNRGGRP